MSEPMTSVPVPAAMPRESLNDLIDRARVAMAVYSDDGDFYGSEIISDLINALGEKEREIGEKHQAFSIAHDQAMANGNAAQLAEARALAAEAALAGEREALDPFAKAGEQWKGWHPDTRLMCQGADAGLTIGDLYRAAAIRAQGE